MKKNPAAEAEQLRLIYIGHLLFLGIRDSSVLQRVRDRLTDKVVLAQRATILDIDRMLNDRVH